MLALNGGAPVRTKEWPKWPFWTKGTLRKLNRTARSGRWAISGPYMGSISEERRFSHRFAEFNHSKYCVPTANGTSSLLIALESLDVGCGDEVLLPGLTWVACPSTILNVNATPVFVDIDPNTLSISIDDLISKTTKRTKCVLLVHLYCSLNDMTEMKKVSRELGVPIIEDCSHAHGAEWKNQKAGTIGEVGCFSMQQTKVLTCGEGGAAITNSPRLFERLEQLRSDGRRFASHPKQGEMELEEGSEVMGNNYCLSEFHAALLNDQIERLDEQNRIRQRNARYLDEKLRKLGGLKPVARPPEANKITYYHYAIRFDPDSFANRPLTVICRALERELGFPFTAPYEPLTHNPLYRPWTKRRYVWALRGKSNKKYELKGADEVHQSYVTFHHAALLGTTRDMDDIVSAFAKIQIYSDNLPVR